MKNIKALIFDLGGVILNIKYQNTMQSFKNLGLLNSNNFYSKRTQSEIFNLIETGQINADQFLAKLKELNPDTTIEQIRDGWNSMLLDLPEERLILLNRLKRKYKLFLLSNTNIIHITEIKKKIGKQKWNSFKNTFNRIYLSYKIGERKPNIKIFEYVLKQEQLKTDEVLFIDDSSQHIKSARKLGIKCIHLKKEDDIITLFPDKVR